MDHALSMRHRTIAVLAFAAFCTVGPGCNIVNPEEFHFYPWVMRHVKVLNLFN